MLSRFYLHSNIIFKGWLLWVQKPKDPKTDSERATAVERARTCIGKLKGQYNLLTSNCEHLVSYWLTTDGYSIQSGREVKEICVSRTFILFLNILFTSQRTLTMFVGVLYSICTFDSISVVVESKVQKTS